MSRKLMLNDEMIDQFCDCMSLGLSNVSACELVGVTQDTFYRWLRVAEAYKEHLEEGGERQEGKEIYLRFSERVTRARRKCEATLARQIQEAVPKDWKAAAYLIERCFPDQWAKRDKVDITSGGEKLEGPVIYLPGQDEE